MDALTNNESAAAGNRRHTEIKGKNSAFFADGNGPLAQARAHVERSLGAGWLSTHDMTTDGRLLQAEGIQVGRIEDLAPGNPGIHLLLTDGDQYTADGELVSQFWSFAGKVNVPAATYLIRVYVWQEYDSSRKFLVEQAKFTPAVDVEHLGAMLELFTENLKARPVSVARPKEKGGILLHIPDPDTVSRPPTRELITA